MQDAEQRWGRRQARPRNINNSIRQCDKHQREERAVELKGERKEEKKVHRELRSCIKRRSEVACMRLT